MAKNIDFVQGYSNIGAVPLAKSLPTEAEIALQDRIQDLDHLHTQVSEMVNNQQLRTPAALQDLKENFYSSKEKLEQDLNVVRLDYDPQREILSAFLTLEQMYNKSQNLLIDGFHKHQRFQALCTQAMNKLSSKDPDTPLTPEEKELIEQIKATKLSLPPSFSGIKEKDLVIDLPDTEDRKLLASAVNDLYGRADKNIQMLLFEIQKILGFLTLLLTSVKEGSRKSVADTVNRNKT